MASGELGPVIESQVMALAEDGRNETGNVLFKMAPGIYMLVYLGVTLLDMRFATFAIDEVTGLVNGTPIDEFDIGYAYSTFDNYQNTVIQLPGTRILVTGSNGAGDALNIRTVTCDADGTNIAQVSSANFAGFSANSITFMTNLGPGIVALAGLGGTARINTFSVNEVTGAINSTPIQAAESLGISDMVGLAHVRDNIGVAMSTSGSLTVSTFTLNLDGTFDTTKLDSLVEIWSRTVSSSQLNAISKADGILEWSGYSQNFSNRIERYIRVTVSSLGIITFGLNFESQQAQANKYRPTTFSIGDGVYVFLQEGSNIIRTIPTIGLGVGDTEAVPVTAGTKGVAFAIVSPTIGAMAHIGNDALGVIQYVTTYSLENTFGAEASPIAISAQVGMQQRELLLW